MKQRYRLKNLGCANCAAKMERDIGKLAGVTEANINFMTTTLSLEADDAQFDAILEQAKRIIARYEPEVTLQRA